VVLDCAAPLRRPLRLRLTELSEVSIGRGTTRAVETGTRDDTVVLRLPDAWMSTSHLRLRTVGDAWVYEDAGAKNLTMVNGAPSRQALLGDGDLLQAGGT